MTAQRATTAAFATAQTGEFPTPHGAIVFDVLAADGESAAEKPWITLLHNFLSTGRTAWAAIAPKLAEHYRVLVPDLPGHGRSRGHPPEFEYRAMAQQVAGLMEHLGASDGHLAGASAGGMVAQWLVAEKWATPATLTLISTTHSANPATAGAPVTTDPERFRFGSRWLEATAELHDPHQGAGYFRRELLAATRDARRTLDLPLDALADWPMPVCIIHGEEDEFFPVEIARRMAAALPAAQLHVIPGQSHALIFRQGWKVAELMMSFLRAQSPSLE